MVPASILPQKTEVNGKTRYTFPKLDQLEQALTPEYTEYVVRAQEHAEKYGTGGGSRFNMILVMMQVIARFPDQAKNAVPYLTIRTFHEWKKEGRKVNKGETAMQCLTMMHASTKNEETGEREENEDVLYRKTAHVFGIWQTSPIQA